MYLNRDTQLDPDLLRTRLAMVRVLLGISLYSICLPVYIALVVGKMDLK